jgi:hypothetical protein
MPEREALPVDFSRKYDTIKYNDAAAGARLAKVAAEIHMAVVLKSGWAICVVIGVFLAVREWDWQRFWVALGLLVPICAAEAVKRYLKSRLDTGVENYADLVGYSSRDVVTKVS